MKGHVLLIEDESCLAQIMDLELSEAGYEVTTVNNGTTGLRQTQFLKPDVLLLDWGLPGMSGLDVCETLRSQGNEVPIIFITSRAEEDGKAEALRAGASDYVMKPFSLDELLSKMEQILGAIAPATPSTAAA